MENNRWPFYFIDTHAHLDMLKKMTPEFAVQQSLQEGVKYIINPGSSISGSIKSCQYSSRFENVYSSVGIHPHDAEAFDKNTLIMLENMIKENKKIVAIGETGFDYFRNLSPKQKQKNAFISQIELALKYNLPLIIHDRDAHEDTLEILKTYAGNSGNKNKSAACKSKSSNIDSYSIGENAVHAARINQGNGVDKKNVDGCSRLQAVIHCFSGSTDFALKCLELGFYISFTGVITFPNAKEMLQTVKEIPLEKMFLETDSPFLAPQEKRGQENYPGFVKYIANKIADVKGLTIEEVAQATSENAEQFFKLM